MTRTTFDPGDDEVRKAVDLLRSKGYWVVSPGPLGESVFCAPLTRVTETNTWTATANINLPISGTWNGGAE